MEARQAPRGCSSLPNTSLQEVQEPAAQTLTAAELRQFSTKWKTKQKAPSWGTPEGRVSSRAGQEAAAAVCTEWDGKGPSPRSRAGLQHKVGPPGLGGPSGTDPPPALVLTRHRWGWAAVGVQPGTCCRRRVLVPVGVPLGRPQLSPWQGMGTPLLQEGGDKDGIPAAASTCGHRSASRAGASICAHSTAETRPLQVHWGKWGVGGVCMLGSRGEGKRGVQGAAWRSSGVEHSTAPVRS